MTDRRIVLAYAGGLETTVAIPWLAGRHGAGIVTVTLDLGQGGDLAGVRQRALDAGAVRAHVLDVREEFARDYALRALRAGACDEPGPPLSVALGRCLLARHLVAVAAMEQADSIAHGCRDEDDQHRLEAAVRSLGPRLTLIATRHRPLTEDGRLEIAREHGPTDPPASGARIDSNLWGRTIECGMLVDPWVPPPEEVFALTRPRTTCPDQPAMLEIEFVQGLPTRVNGVAMGPVELLASLDTIAGAHGVGRIDRMAPRMSGATSRAVGEAPAAVVLAAARREVAALTHARDLEDVARMLGRVYADLIEQGRWHSPAREAIDAFVDRAQQDVTGLARLELFKGSCLVAGRGAPRASHPS